MRFKVFISSVQTEFAKQRKMLSEYITSDALLGKFFEVFIFENIPALDNSTRMIYLDEVKRSDIYLGLFGKSYGYEDTDGISPTEHEFNCARDTYKTKFIYITNHDDSERHPKELKLIQKAEEYVVRKKFSDELALKASVYNSLVRFLEENEYIRTLPFDATFNRKATIKDLDKDKIRNFVYIARRKRGFPFSPEADPEVVLTHLNLIEDNKITNAAILLFGKNPQRFFISSEVKCAHFHGYDVVKPIPSYQVYKGDVFDLITQAVNFVLSNIASSVGVRDSGAEVDVEYEIPIPAITEAIVNAVAHRDYTSNGSIQVMLFKDRLEIWNPGHLPLGLTVAKLKEYHHSIPVNPLIAEPMYLNGTIERMGTGTRDIVQKCLKAGLKEPVFYQEEFFRVVLWRESPSITPPITPPITPLIPPPKEVSLTDLEQSILDLIENDNKISMTKMAAQLEIGRDTVKEYIKRLREKQRITRIGSNRGGYWKVL